MFNEEILNDEIGLDNKIIESKYDDNIHQYFTYIPSHSNDKMDEMFDNVVGHENQKKELSNIIKWFSESEKYNINGLKIPTGVILYGNPGNGKSLLMKDIIENAGFPVFIFDGAYKDTVVGLNRTFEASRKEKKAIIIIDELDLLINKNNRIIRALQENLDGVISTNSNNILVICATNFIDEIPEALQRSGRLEKQLYIPGPTEYDIETLLKKHFKEFNVEYPADLENDELSIFTNIEFSGVRSVANDVVLRNFGKKITSEMIFDSFNNVLNRSVYVKPNVDKHIAIHEAGHIVSILLNNKYLDFKNVIVHKNSGQTRFKLVNENYEDYDALLSEMQVALSGYLAEKIIFNCASNGCNDDLNIARRISYGLFSQYGFGGVKLITAPKERGYGYAETEARRRPLERKAQRLIRKYEKLTYKVLKKHIPEIELIASKIIEKGCVRRSEIYECLKDNEILKFR